MRNHNIKHRHPKPTQMQKNFKDFKSFAFLKDIQSFAANLVET